MSSITNYFWGYYSSFKSSFTRPTLSTDVITIQDIDYNGMPVFVDLPWGFDYTTSNFTFWQNYQSKLPAGVVTGLMVSNRDGSGLVQIKLASDYSRWITIRIDPNNTNFHAMYNSLFNYEFIMPNQRNANNQFLRGVQVAATFSQPLQNIYKNHCVVGYRNIDYPAFKTFRRFLLPTGGNLVIPSGVSIMDATTNNEHVDAPNLPRVLDLTNYYGTPMVKSYDLLGAPSNFVQDTFQRYRRQVPEKYLTPESEGRSLQVWDAKRYSLDVPIQLVTEFYDFDKDSSLGDGLVYFMGQDEMYNLPPAPPNYEPPPQSAWPIPNFLDRDPVDYSIII